VRMSVIRLFQFYVFNKADLTYFFFTDKWSYSKEYTSYFQVSATHDRLLLTICAIRTNNLLVSILWAISMDSFLVIKFLFYNFHIFTITYTFFMCFIMGYNYIYLLFYKQNKFVAQEKKIKFSQKVNLLYHSSVQIFVSETISLIWLPNVCNPNIWRQ
jgi:hypothetical protein